MSVGETEDSHASASRRPGRSVAILAGEASGDAYGAMLATVLRRQDPSLSIWGLGGARMHAAGVQIVADCRDSAAIGVFNALRVIPKLRFRVYPALCRELQRRRPDLVVPIDFGAFNVPMARRCRELGLRVLYYLPPGSWRRDGPLPCRLARITDRIATQFPWSSDRLAAAGADPEFVGHPILDLITDRCDEGTLLTEAGLSPGNGLVALLPGSRSAELRENVPAIARAAVLVHRTMPGLRFIIALAPGTDCERVEKLARPLLGLRDGMGQPIAGSIQGYTHELLRHAQAGLVCSGTATLEAAILGMPMVVLYRGSLLMYAEYIVRGLSRLKYISLPNIIAQETIVPELIARDATPEAMAHHLLALLQDPERAGTMREQLSRVRESLGSPGATRRTADMVMAMLDGAGD